MGLMMKRTLNKMDIMIDQIFFKFFISRAMGVNLSNIKGS